MASFSSTAVTATLKLHEHSRKYSPSSYPTEKVLSLSVIYSQHLLHFSHKHIFEGLATFLS